MNTHNKNAVSDSDTRIEDDEEKLSSSTPSKVSNHTQVQENISVDHGSTAYLDESRPLFRAMEMRQPTELYLEHGLLPGLLPRLETGEKYCVEPIAKILPDYNIINHNDVCDTWDLEVLPRMPEMYSLAKSSFAVDLSDGTTVEGLANNIHASNKDRSIKVDYYNEDATAKCKTRSFMKFDVRFFQGEANNAIVEVRRRSGCSLAFNEEYQHIFQLLNFKALPRHGNPRVSVNLADIDFIPLPETTIEATLELCLNNISSDNYDTRIHAIEELVKITDPSCTEIAPTVCNLILQRYEEIFKSLINIVHVLNDDDDDDDDSLEYRHCIALTVIRNIGVLSSENHTFFLMIQSEKSFVYHLVGNIKMAAKHPWNACLASKCLFLLMTNPNTAMLNDTMLNVVDDARYALKNAQTIGEKSYALLEQETTEAIGIMADSFGT